MTVSDLETRVLERALHRSPACELPPAAGDRMAAVCLLLRPGPPRSSVLFVRRAEAASDPWSGHVALPGGHADPGDADLIETARRETLEEVGLDIPRDAFLGRLDDRRPGVRLPSIIVRPFVATWHGEADIVASPEIAGHLWIPRSVLEDPEHRGSFVLRRGGTRRTFPAIHYREHTIWGLTYRIVEDFLARTRALKPASRPSVPNRRCHE